MKTSQIVALCFASALIAGSLLFNGYAALKAPRVVVYLDKDTKQPATLPLPETKAVTGDRAVLWWTVFCKASERQFMSDAKETANSAVKNVYGEAK